MNFTQLKFSVISFFIFFGNKVFYGIKCFLDKRGTILSAGATFYAIMSFLPLMILILSSLSVFLVSKMQAEEQILSLLQHNFPEISPVLLSTIKKVLKQDFKLSSGLEIISFTMLFWTATAVFRAIFVTLNDLNAEIKRRRGNILIKSFMLFILLLIFMSFLLIWSPLLMMVLRVLENNSLVLGGIEFVKDWTGFHIDYLIISKIRWVVHHLAKSNIIPFIITFGIFVILYRFFIHRKIRWDDAICGALCFSFLYLIGKSLFWLYLAYARVGLVRNYGEFYSLIVMLLWVYFIFCSFFFGAFVTHVEVPRRQKDNKI